MSDIKKWKTPAASNVGAEFAPPDGFPEGMLRSDVNNSMREIQASVRRMWDDPDWKNPVDGFTVIQGADNTKVKIQATNATGYFNVNQKVRVRSSSSATGYAFVTTAVLDGSDTVVTLEDFDASGSPMPPPSVPADCNGIDIYFLGGGDTNNHGIGRSAFTGGASVAFQIPEGSTATAINAAIVVAASEGKVVLLPAGTITLDATISIPDASDGIKLLGPGVNQTSLTMGNGLNLDVITIGAGADNVTIEGFTINGNCTNQTTGGHGITAGDNVTTVRIIEMVIQNCWGNAINFGGTASGGGETYSDIVIRDTKITRCGNTGIYFNDANGLSDGIFISDVNVSQFGDTGDATTSGANACGINFAGSAQMEGITINATSTAAHASFAGAAIRLRESGTGGAPPGGHNCQISNFKLTGDLAGVIGLHVRGSDSQISNGHIDLSGTGTVRPIVVEGAGAGTESASDNILSNIHVADGTRSEILGTADRVMLSDCHFTAASETALLIGGDYTKVFNCSFDGGTSAYSIVKTIVTQAGSDGIEIKGCLLRGTTGDCITLVGDSHNVNGCTISDITGNAITLASGAANCVVTNNVIDGVSGAGITIASGATNGIASMNRCANVSGENYVNAAGSYEGRFEGNFPEFMKMRDITFVTNAMNNWSPDISPIPDLTNIEYPVAPNGSRRFLITAHVLFQTGSDFESNRIVGMRLYSTEDYSVSTGSAFETEYVTGDIESWHTGSRGELAIQDKVYTPAANERITVSMDEQSANNQSDLLADSGSGPMFNYEYTVPSNLAGTFNTYGSTRCYLCVEYLDEG